MDFAGNNILVKNKNHQPLKLHIGGYSKLFTRSRYKHLFSFQNYLFSWWSFFFFIFFFLAKLFLGAHQKAKKRYELDF